MFETIVLNINTTIHMRSHNDYELQSLKSVKVYHDQCNKIGVEHKPLVRIWLEYYIQICLLYNMKFEYNDKLLN